MSVTGIVLYLLDQCFFKLSLAFFFLRIASRPLHRWIIRITVSISLLCNLVLLGITVGQCGDIATIDLNQPHCLSWRILGPLNYLCASLNALVDWLFATLAIHVVRGLMLEGRIRSSVCGIILLATAGSIVSIVRIPFISGLRLDESYYSQRNNVIAYVSLIESAVGTIVASLSVMRPLLARYGGGAKIAVPLTSRAASFPGPTLKSHFSQTIDLSVCGTDIKLFQALPDLMPSLEAEACYKNVTDYVASKLETVKEENITN